MSADRPCCNGWGEVLYRGREVVACPTCYPDAYEVAVDVEDQ